jgi:hypothetical protein
VRAVLQVLANGLDAVDRTVQRAIRRFVEVTDRRG